MVTKIEIVPATLEHAVHIASNMRKADLEEVAVSSGRGPLAVFRDSLASATVAWTGLVNGVPACMFGVGAIDILGGAGCPWLLGTGLIEQNAMAFLRRSKPYLFRMLDVFPYLYNFVDARNTLSLKWLEWLGFNFDEKPVSYGVWAMPFYRFEMRRV